LPGRYDEQETGALTSRIDDDVGKVQEAIGDKLGNFIQFISMFVAGMIIAFVYGWKLALVILSVTPLLAFVGFFFTKFMSEATSKSQESYSEAGSVAYEAIGLIKTVVAFGTQRFETERYTKNVDKATAIGVKSGRANGIGMGAAMAVMFAT
jgi:ABC-type multidrug transport system fused ATPase/permease subunit